eukprot:c16090_g1_i1.p2 GENE.c16090_g1_i1~~c16090_g1_i1.p2  ORF type:complete len:136 (+),score=23.95 c16090_g1_i1:110-517(+)
MTSEKVCARLYVSKVGPLYVSQCCVGMIQIASSLVISTYLALQRCSQTRFSGFLILPIYFLMIWAFVFADGTLGAGVMVCPVDFQFASLKPHVSCSAFLGLGFGLSRAAVSWFFSFSQLIVCVCVCVWIVWLILV